MRAYDAACRRHRRKSSFIVGNPAGVRNRREKRKLRASYMYVYICIYKAKQIKIYYIINFFNEDIIKKQ